MRFFLVFLGIFLITSCNDSDKKEIVDCSKIQDGAQVSKQCLLGSWYSDSGGSNARYACTGGKIKIDENKIVGDFTVLGGDNACKSIDLDNTYTYEDGKIIFTYQGNPMSLTVSGVGSDRRRLIRISVPSENGRHVWTTTWYKLLDCSIALDEKCPLGKWKIQSAKLGEKDQALADLTLTERQKDQALDLKSDKISGKIVLVRVDQIALEDSPIQLSESVTFYNFMGKDMEKEITFKKNGDGEVVKLKIKEVKDNQLTLELSGKTTGTPAKDYVLETLWSKE